jgi:filamentous hemagglutinin family protein
MRATSKSLQAMLRLASLMAIAISTAAYADETLPTGGAFTNGTGSITTSADMLQVAQSSSKAVIDWQGFSIGAGRSVDFQNGSGVTLNRVTGLEGSVINGLLSATGSVYLINPQGVVIGPGGQISAGNTFIASTRDLDNAQFLSGGALTFSGSGSGAVSNGGQIVSHNGDVILVGGAVSNMGRITASQGTVSLASGDVVLVSPQARGNVSVVAVKGGGDVTNSGRIIGAGVRLDAAAGTIRALVSTGAAIEATGTQTLNGEVWLTGGTSIEVAQTISAINEDGSGGEIKATAPTITLQASSRLIADGTRGGKIDVIASEKGTVTATGYLSARATGLNQDGGQIETSGDAVNYNDIRVNRENGSSIQLT